jgi:TrmH family RNA methyltransferase
MPHAGPGHPRIKQYLNVRHNRGAARGAIALEGLWALRAAVDAGVVIEVVFVCAARLPGAEVWALLHRTDALVLEVSERVLTRLVDRDGPDGIAALARLPVHSLDDIDVGPSTRIVVADHLELAGNLGTLIRCADGAGATALVVTDRRVRRSHPLIVKASMGTVFTVPVVDADRADALAFLRSHGVRTIAADPGAAVSYRHADYRGPVAIVLGSERAGLDPFWRASADTVVAIPMLGVADSLNVGHAAALLLYEALWQQSESR